MAETGTAAIRRRHLAFARAVFARAEETSDTHLANIARDEIERLLTALEFEGQTP